MTTPPANLLATAEAILDGALRIGGGLRARAAALLARQALEQALDDFWQCRAAAVRRCSVRTQIQCLSAYLDPEPVASAAIAWNRLSDTCHHHPYAVAPSSAELRAWIGCVRAFCAHVPPRQAEEAAARA
jgi:hypothetical protein